MLKIIDLVQENLFNLLMLANFNPSSNAVSSAKFDLLSLVALALFVTIG